MEEKIKNQANHKNLSSVEQFKISVLWNNFQIMKSSFPEQWALTLVAQSLFCGFASVLLFFFHSWHRVSLWNLSPPADESPPASRSLLPAVAQGCQGVFEELLPVSALLPRAAPMACEELAAPSGTFTRQNSSTSSLDFEPEADYRFVESLEERYKCAYCRRVLRNPHQTGCGHRFCQQCILALRWEHTPPVSAGSPWFLS